MTRTVTRYFAPAYLAGLLACSAVTAAPRPDCTGFDTNDRLDSHDRQWCQALALKETYLNKGFVESVPGSDGLAREVTSRLATRFSSGGSSSISGTVTIGGLDGRFRLKLARTSNSLYYGRKIQIDGTARSDDGRLEIYSHVDVDLWKLAAVLVDRPVRDQDPPEDGLILKGYLGTEVRPGTDQEFTATLIPIGSDFFLLLAAPDGPVRGIRLVIEEP